MQQVIYNTGSGNKYPIELSWKVISYRDIIYEPFLINQLCKEGCKNYGKSGGCPPHAPWFEYFDHKNKMYILLVGKFYSKYKTKKVRECKNRAIHWKFQDVILARFLDKIGRRISELVDGDFFSTGYCMGCHGKKCSVKSMELCRNPAKRTFSMEATGINVVKTVQRCLGEQFYWYTKTNLDIPYMMKAILISASMVSMDIDKVLVNCINSFDNVFLKDI